MDYETLKEWEDTVNPESLTVVKKCKKCGYKPRNGDVLASSNDKLNNWHCPKCKTVNVMKYDTVKATDKQVGGNHYKDKKLQPWDIIDALDLNFYEGNALKYLIRYKDKNGVEDLKKSIHYIEKIIEDVSSTTSSSN